MKNWLMTLTALFLGVVLAQSNPDISRVQMQMALAGHAGGFVNSVAFSPDGQLLATGGQDAKVIIWNVRTGQKIRELGGIRILFGVWLLVQMDAHWQQGAGMGRQNSSML